jgi:hypothetical protein
MVTSLKGSAGLDTSHDVESESFVFFLVVCEVIVKLVIRRKSDRKYFVISENGLV